MLREHRGFIRSALALAGVIGLSVALAAGQARADGASRAVDEEGICTLMGCKGGEIKCATGTSTSGGTTVEFTCYTKDAT